MATSWTRPDAYAALDDAALVELIRAACAEAMKRGETVRNAARRAMLTEAEATALRMHAAELDDATKLAAEEARLQVRAGLSIREAADKAAREEIARVAAEKERAVAEKQRTAWARKKAVALAVQSLVTDREDLSVSVWESGGGIERRVYLNTGRKQIACLHVTGSRRTPPGTLEVTAHREARRPQFHALLTAVSQWWTSVNIDVAVAAKWDGQAAELVLPPIPEAAP